MAKFGGLAPYPRRFGGAKPRVQQLFEAMASDMGTAYEATNANTIIYVQTVAFARGLSAVWGANERLAKTWQPLRCPEYILKMWEGILQVPPDAKDTVYERRLRVDRVFKRWGRPSSLTVLASILTDQIGSVFVSVEQIGQAYAQVTVPDNTYGFGSVVDGKPWSSTASKVLVRLNKPTYMTTEEFFRNVAKMQAVLDSVLPVWATSDWYTNPGPNGTDLVDGPDAAGFYLDQANNLDGAIFDV